jgi:PmbA protein
MNEEILENCIKAVKIGEKLGCNQVECFTSITDSINISVRKGEIKIAKKIVDGGLGVRCVVNNAIGFSYLTNPNEIEKCVTKAFKQARSTPSDPEFKSFAEKGKYQHVYNIFDENIANLDVEEAIRFINEVLKQDFTLDKRIKSINLTFGSGRNIVAIANSLGVEGVDKGTFLYFYSSISAEENGKFSGSDEIYVSRKIKDFQPVEVSKVAYEYAIKGLNKKKIPSAKVPVILDPFASFFIIGMSLRLGLNADAIQRKRSYLSNQIGNKIANEKITVIDDGLLEGGIGSFKFDAEGFPSSRNIIIENGTLKNYFYDTYTANKEGKSSTGNAVRGEGSIWNFRSLPRIDSRNLIIKEGSKSYKDFISEIKKGVYIRSTYDYPNVVTGEFSGMINEGFLIEDGEIKHALLQAGIGLNLRETFQKIIELSKEIKWYGGIALPYILIEEANIAGE